MKQSLIITLAVLGLLLVSGTYGHKISDLDRLVYKEELTELHWFYNKNMDATTALRSTRPANNAEFLQRVENVRGIFCPDPLFQGWLATGGINGATSLAARYRDLPDPANGNMSVTSIYRDVLPIIFGNSSQHFVGMPIITIAYGEDGIIRAEFNASLRQVVNIMQSPPAMITDIIGNYNNKFMRIDPPGQGDDNAYWCMYQFNAFNSFSFAQIPSTYFLTDQNAVNGQLGGYVRPV